MWPALSIYSWWKICIFTNEGYSSAECCILQLSRAASVALLQLLCSSRSLFIQIVHHLDSEVLSSSSAAVFSLSKVQKIQESKAQIKEGSNGQYTHEDNLYFLNNNKKEDRLITGLTRAARGSSCQKDWSNYLPSKNIQIVAQKESPCKWILLTNKLRSSIKYLAEFISSNIVTWSITWKWDVTSCNLLLLFPMKCEYHVL